MSDSPARESPLRDIMCTRFACSLEVDELRKACSYRHEGIHRQPDWLDTGEVYAVSYNVCAHETMAVLVAGSLVGSDQPRVLMPMKWGMIPSWHSGVSWKPHHRLDTTFCRSEAASVSRFCGKPFNHGRRCVIVCDGFYEWQREFIGRRRIRQPFFIFREQPEGVSIGDHGPWTWSAKSGWFGPCLLNIAGVFETWVSALGEQYYSFTMLTTAAHPSLTWLGQRQPAILDSEADVEAWLDSETITSAQALTRLVPVGTPTLCWHSVSKHVNSAKNKDRLCSWPCDPDSLLEQGGRGRKRSQPAAEDEDQNPHNTRNRPTKTQPAKQKRGKK